MLAGAALAQSSSTVGPGLIAAFFSHFLLDHMPHHEYRVDALRTPLKREVILDSLKVTMDLAAGSAAVFFLYGTEPPLVVLLGALLGILPDGIWMLGRFIKINLFERFQRIHRSFHAPPVKAFSRRALFAEIAVISAALLLWYTGALGAGR